MPRGNVGTLLENIVLVEVARSLVNQTSTGQTIDFINSFAMPPLSEWRYENGDRGLSPDALSNISKSDQFGLDYMSLLRTCLKYDETSGPNGALLVSLILHLAGRRGRFWLNDLSEDAARYSNSRFSFKELFAAMEDILQCSMTSAMTVATSEKFFPDCLKDLEDQIVSWKFNPAATLGYLDPDMYSTSPRDESKAHTDSASVQKFLTILSNNSDAPVACVHFTANQMHSKLLGQIASLQSDGEATGFNSNYCKHGRFVVFILHRNCNDCFMERIKIAWNEWFKIAYGRENAFRLEIH